MRRSLAALTVVALAGVTVAAATLPDDAIEFATPVYVSGAQTSAAEPSIRVDTTDPNGRIWVAAPAGLGLRSPALDLGGDLFWTSDDRGESWTLITGAAGETLLGGGDSDVATTVDGTVYVTGLTLANVTLATSPDDGATWFTNPISNLGAVEDRQWIDTWEDNPKPGPTAPDLLLAYGAIAEGAMHLHQVVAPLGGPPVAPPAIVLNLPDCLGGLSNACYQWPGSLWLDETTGDAFVTWNTGDDRVVVARVDGAGNGPVTQLDAHVVTAADRRGIGDTYDSFTVVTTDAAGNVYVAWSERMAPDDDSDGETRIMLAVSTDHGDSYGEPIQVNSSPVTNTFPWIVAGDEGRVGVVWYGTHEPATSPEMVAEEAQWRVWSAISLDAHTSAPTFVEAPATGVMHQGSICTSGTGCSGNTRNLLDYFQVDVDAEGLLNVIYTDDFNDKPGDSPTRAWVTFVRQLDGPRLFAVNG